LIVTPLAAVESAFRYPLGDGRTPPTVTQRFGEGHCHEGRCRYGHLGDDLRARTPLSVYAVGSGVVTLAADLGGQWGNVVIVRHNVAGWDEPLFTMYAHLSRLDVRQGDEVGRGRQLGLTGTAPGSTAPHLHFELRTGRDAGTNAGRGYLGRNFTGDTVDVDGLRYIRPSSFIANHLA
jgi:murein DD-endopeptidase MepM/ murein hydrolase activator NlpD